MGKRCQSRLHGNMLHCSSLPITPIHSEHKSDGPLWHTIGIQVAPPPTETTYKSRQRHNLPPRDNKNDRVNVITFEKLRSRCDHFAHFISPQRPAATRPHHHHRRRGSGSRCRQQILIQDRTQRCGSLYCIVHRRTQDFAMEGVQCQYLQLLSLKFEVIVLSEMRIYGFK